MNIYRRYFVTVCALYALFYIFPHPFASLPYVGDALFSYYGIFLKTVFHWVLPGAEIPGPYMLESYSSGDFSLHFFSMGFSLVLAIVGGSLLHVVNLSSEKREDLLSVIHILIRFYLGLFLIGYGLVKVFPAQFPSATLLNEMQPLGQISPMGLLWRFMGYSKVYAAFGGVLEVLAGALILLPAVFPIGLALAIPVMANVAMINLCYDVPVKLLSLHMVGFSFALFCPYLKSIWKVLVVTPFSGVSETSYFGKFLSNKNIWIAVQVLLAFTLFYTKGLDSYSVLDFRKMQRADVPFQGIWGRDASDTQPWARAIFDLNGRMTLQKKSGEMVYFKMKAQKDQEHHFEVTEKDHEKRSFLWEIRESKEGTLEIIGPYGKQSLSLSLKKQELPPSILSTRTFEWVQGTAYTR